MTSKRTFGLRRRWFSGACVLVLALSAFLGIWPVAALYAQEDSKPAKTADRDRSQDQSQDQAGDQGKQDQGKKQKKATKKERAKEAAKQLPTVLWRDPGDVASRDLVNGAGGAAHAPDPNADYKFVKEDTNGTSPKFYVRDRNGVEWLVKLGVEAKPETVATRFVWAVGYFADEDYFLPQIHVNGMQQLHHRIADAWVKTGDVPNARLKRQGPETKKVENWSWVDNPFRGTREFSGLLVMMAVINNWDLKEVNNKVYVADNERHFVVSDLGAAFGKTGMPLSRSPVLVPLPHATKGVLKDYQDSKFINSVHGGSVQFVMNISTPFFIKGFRPKFFNEYSENKHLEKGVPVEDVRWIAQELAQLKPRQIRDAFRTAGYEPDEIEGYAQVVQRRIAQLNQMEGSDSDQSSRQQ